MFRLINKSVAIEEKVAIECYTLRLEMIVLLFLLHYGTACEVGSQDEMVGNGKVNCKTADGPKKITSCLDVSH